MNSLKLLPSPLSYIWRPILLAVVGFCLASGAASAATCTATATAPQPRNWSVAGTWSCGNVPANGDFVVIPNGATVTLNVNTNRVADLTINVGGVLQGDNTNKILTINNGTGTDVTNNGQIQFGTGNLATIFTRQASQWTGTGTWNLSTLDLNAKTLTFAAGSTLTVNMSGAAAPIVNAGTVTSLSTVTWEFSGTAGQTLPASTNVRYGNLTISNTTGVTLGVGLTATTLLGNLTVAANGILNNGGFAVTLAAAKNFAVNAGGVFNLTGTSTMVAVSGGGTKTFNATSTVNYAGAAQTVSTDAYGHLTLSGSGTKTMSAGALAVAGNFTMSGTAATTAVGAMAVDGNFTLGGGTTFNAAALSHAIKGNFSNSGTFTPSTSTITLNGTSAQDIGGSAATTFNNLTINNSAGVTLSTVDPTINATLTLTSGNITAGSRKMIIATGGTVSRTSGHVIGQLQKNVATGATSRTFEVGSATAYAPVTLAFGNVTTAGNLIAKSVSAEHPDIANSVIDSIQDVSRYWLLTNSGGGVVFDNYTATFSYASGSPVDLDSGVVAAGFVIGKADGCNGSLLSCTWTAPTVSGTPTSTTAVASGLTSIDSTNGSGFAVGHRKLNNFLVEAAGGGSIGTQTPGVAFSIQVTARDASNNTLANFTGTVDITSTCTLSSGSGTTASFVTGILASHSVTISSTGSCSITATRTSGTEAGTSNSFTVGSTAAGFNACSDTDACPTSSALLYTRIANRAFAIYLAALKSDGTVSAVFNGSAAVSLLGSIASGGAIGGDNCPSGAVDLTQALGTLAFTSGKRTQTGVTVANAYRDVRVKFICDSTNCPPSGITVCSNDNFAVRPDDLALSATISSPLKAGDIANGDTFSLSAVASGNATTTTSYNASPQIDLTKIAATNTLPNPNITGTLDGSFGAASGGTASGTFGYSEVGYFSIDINGVHDSGVSRFTAVDAFPGECTDNFNNAYTATDPTSKVGCKFGNQSASGNIGRFRPSHFQTVVTGTMSCTGLSFTPACPSIGNYLTYSGLAFTTVITAYRVGGSGAGGITQNYAGTSANNITLSAWDAIGSTTQQNPPASGGASSFGPVIAAASFTLGQATTSTPTYSFSIAPTAPTNIYVRATDTDTVSSLRTTSPLTTSVEGGIKVASGRLQFENMYGPSASRLGTKARALYWSGTQWTLNTSDTVSGAATGNFTLGDSGTCVTPTFCGITLLSAAALGAGEFRLVLTPPTSGSGRRSVLLNSSLSYLAGSGKQTWGSFRAPYIHQQER